MTDYRRRLWLNIMEDLGPPEGCIMPTWLICIYALLFPCTGIRVLIDRSMSFDPFRLVWEIHGIQYSDLLFCRIAVANGELYRFTNVNGVVMIELVHQTQPQISDV